MYIEKDIREKKVSSMKKMLSLILSALILCSFAVPATAVSEKDGMDKLKEQFTIVDKVEGIYDYAYYSPVKDKNDKTKYPVVVWLHGNSSGDYPGHQLDNCNIALWSSEEYQSRFEGTGGAYLFLPRYPTSNLFAIAWEGATSLPKKTIDAFVKANIDTIDTNKIYIGGYSMGGKMTLRMAANYPDYFAAAFPLSPVYAPSDRELNDLIDMPLWFFWCKNDDYASLNPVTVRGNWQYLMNISNCKSRCRLSTFDVIYNSDYTVKTADGKNDIHNTWDAACHDMFMNDGQPQKDVTTTDGNGALIKLSHPAGLITWLSHQSKENTFEKEDRTLLDILRGILKAIVQAFTDIFDSLFGK